MAEPEQDAGLERFKKKPAWSDNGQLSSPRLHSRRGQGIYSQPISNQESSLGTSGISHEVAVGNGQRCFADLVFENTHMSRWIPGQMPGSPGSLRFRPAAKPIVISGIKKPKLSDPGARTRRKKQNEKVDSPNQAGPSLLGRRRNSQRAAALWGFEYVGTCRLRTRSISGRWWDDGLYGMDEW